MKKPLLLLLALITGIAITALAMRSRTTQPPIQSQLIAPQPDTSGFARATGPIDLAFPADHGPHPDYLTEWWYYTGNLETADGQHFGFQLTFFRRALAPPDPNAPPRASAWAADQVYLAHFALTDANGQSFQAFERFARGAAGLAGAQADPYRVWLEDWFVEQTAPGVYRLFAAQDGLQLDLTLTDAKGPILQGDRGYSQKGPQPGNASYYISQTRLQAGGSVQTPRGAFQVSGLAWMDHEFSTSALSEGQIGWDWFSVQLDNDIELMFFYLRREDGTIDPFSSGTIIYPDGSTRPLTRQDFSITVLDTWRSPRSGAEYPARWQVDIPSENIRLNIQPWLADQELNVSFTYWEGAVRVTGVYAGQPVTGNGYVEMTGYAGSIAGEF